MTNLTYTCIPTFGPELEPSDSDSWVEPWGDGFEDFQSRIVEHCRELGANGAVTFQGSHGATYLDDSGYESNYTGWVDAREGATA